MQSAVHVDLTPPSPQAARAKKIATLDKFRDMTVKGIAVRV
jgi:hypothetical protein